MQLFAKGMRKIASQIIAANRSVLQCTSIEIVKLLKIAYRNRKSYTHDSYTVYICLEDLRIKFYHAIIRNKIAFAKCYSSFTIKYDVEHITIANLSGFNSLNDIMT